MTDKHLYQIDKNFVKDKIKEALRKNSIGTFDALLGAIQGFSMCVNFLENEIGAENLDKIFQRLPPEAMQTLGFLLNLSEIISLAIKQKGKKINGD